MIRREDSKDTVKRFEALPVSCEKKNLHGYDVRLPQLDSKLIFEKLDLFKKGFLTKENFSLKSLSEFERTMISQVTLLIRENIIGKINYQQFKSVLKS